MEQVALEEYREEILRLREKVGRLDKKIEEAANSGRYVERVRKLRTFRGIDYLTALSVVCEIGDFKRFPTAEAFMSYWTLPRWVDTVKRLAHS
jgi:transposase